MALARRSARRLTIGLFVLPRLFIFANPQLFLRPKVVSTAVTALTPQEFRSGLLCGFFDVVVDVRSRGEWDAGHIEGAALLESLNLYGTEGEISTPADIAGCESCRVVVYCQSGNRAATAAKLLVDAGFHGPIYNGLGVNQWTEAGYSLVMTVSASPPCAADDSVTAMCEARPNRRALASLCEVSLTTRRLRLVIRRWRRMKKISSVAATELLGLVPKEVTGKQIYCAKLSNFVDKVEEFRGEKLISSAATARKLRKRGKKLLKQRDCLVA